MKALLDQLIRATEKYMENEDTDTGTVDTKVTIFYQKGKGAELAAFDVPYCLEKYIDESL